MVNSSQVGPQEMTTTDPMLWRIWAKWPRDPNERRYHPLLCHMLDVAHISRLMWERSLTRTQRQRIAASLSLDERDAATWVAFWAGLHDLGKASPAFQTQLHASKSKQISERDALLVARWLREADLETRDAKWAPHGALSLLFLQYLLADQYGALERLASQVAAIVGAHHGLFFTTQQLSALSRPELTGEGSKWETIQDTLAALVASALALPERVPTGTLHDGDAMAIAGLISVADWIGSNIAYFPLAGVISDAPAPLNLAVYSRDSTRRAAGALADVGWERIDLTNRPMTFAQLFPDKPPRALQSAVIEIAERLNEGGLVIIEAPMGEGKTEAAMYLADHWSVSLNLRGVYFALPTQATSNQMFGRVESYLERRFQNRELVNLHLAHGMAALSDQYERLRKRELVMEGEVFDESGQQEEDDAERGAVLAAEWFAASKRTLLSSYGVGTIDQALLAVLQVKHLFVRLFGLGGKTVILDEVHAYDTYMSTLLERLLEWLGALGSPVVLLSATLPAARRRKLLQRYARGAGWEISEIQDASYPRVTYVSQATAGSEPISATAKARDLVVRWVDGALPDDDQAPFTLARLLAEALREGGCVAVIRNTVRRAQDTYRALEQAFAQLPESARPDLRLLHAQYPYDERHAREDAVLADYGLGSNGKRNPARPRRSVLVSTQVIEQSLDLDFDLMVSDLAPIDLLLQRAGRVHRHSENKETRPPLLQEPTLWVCQPEALPDGTPAFDRGDTYVYDEYVLLRTWRELTTRFTQAGAGDARLAIPGDVEDLIEAVYGDAPLPATVDEALLMRCDTARRRARIRDDRSQSKAMGCRILPPGDPELYTDMNKQLAEDDLETHPTLQAQTREGDLSVPVIFLDARSAATFKRMYAPTRDEARALLGRSLNLSRKGLAEALLHEPVPTGWKKTPWLRNHRAICLDDSGQANVDDGERLHTITLDPTLGVVVRSHKKEM